MDFAPIAHHHIERAVTFGAIQLNVDRHLTQTQMS